MIAALPGALLRASGWLFDRMGGEYALGGMRFAVPATLTDRAFRGALPPRLL